MPMRTFSYGIHIFFLAGMCLNAGLHSIVLAGRTSRARVKSAPSDLAKTLLIAVDDSDKLAMRNPIRDRLHHGLFASDEAVRGKCLASIASWIDAAVYGD